MGPLTGRYDDRDGSSKVKRSVTVPAPTDGVVIVLVVYGVVIVLVVIKSEEVGNGPSTN